MKKTQMTPQQLQERSMLVDRLAAAGWQSNNINASFEKDNFQTHEATMIRPRESGELQVEMVCGDKQLFVFVNGAGGRRLELMFEYSSHLEPLLAALIAIQDHITINNYHSFITPLIDACPDCFTYTADGKKARVVKGASE